MNKQTDQNVRSEVCGMRVQSLCPVCGRVAPAEYVTNDECAPTSSCDVVNDVEYNDSAPPSSSPNSGAVYFEIACPDHGTFRTLASEDPETFIGFMNKRSTTVAPRVVLTAGAKKKHPNYLKGPNMPRGRISRHIINRKIVNLYVPMTHSECPLHCGVCEDHLMTACCVLIDVTARCDQHCPWCFARADENSERNLSEPSLDEIGRWYDRLIELGEERPFNIQLSGGEPAVRSDLPEIVALGRAKGFSYIQLNTNGRRLAGAAASGADDDYGGGEVGEVYARQLAAAGLSVVYLQFDGMSDSVYNELRGEPLLDIKLLAIENCAKAGLPVTLVPTIVKGVNIFEGNDGVFTQSDGEIGRMIDFMLANLNVIKGIHFQPASFFGRHPDDTENRVTQFAVMDEIEKQTDGRIRKSDLLPITTGHALCCFCANFLREPDGSLTSTMSQSQKENGAACCDETTMTTDEPACCCAPSPDPLEVIRRDRDFVLNKWTATPRPDLGVESDAEMHSLGVEPDVEPDAVMSLDDAYLWFRSNMFTISGMAFMDRSNLDAERLKRCRVQYFTPDEKLIPFCAYNTMYRD